MISAGKLLAFFNWWCQNNTNEKLRHSGKERDVSFIAAPSSPSNSLRSAVWSFVCISWNLPVTKVRKKKKNEEKEKKKKKPTPILFILYLEDATHTKCSSRVRERKKKRIFCHHDIEIIIVFCLSVFQGHCFYGLATETSRSRGAVCQLQS